MHNPLISSAIGAKRGACLLLTLIILGGCGEIDSTELATNQVDASIEVLASQRYDSRARVYLRDGFDDVVLKGGDRLTMTTDLDPERDFDVDSFGTYELSLSDNATEATVSFLREDKKSAPSSTVMIPARLDLAAPLDGTDVSLATGNLTLSWSNPIADAKIDVWTVGCGAAGGGVGLFPEDPPDDGSLTIPLSDLGGVGDCTTIVITRVVPGSIDPALDPDSTIEGMRDQQFDVTIVP